MILLLLLLAQISCLQSELTNVQNRLVTLARHQQQLPPHATATDPVKR